MRSSETVRDHDDGLVPVQVDLPWMVWTLPLMRLLPVWAFDGLADFFGITVAMDELTGRDAPAS